MELAYPERTRLLPILSFGLGVLTLLLLAIAGYEGTLKAPDSPWFKPAKYTACLAFTTLSYGVIIRYLPIARQRILFGAIVAFLLSWLMVFPTWLFYQHHVRTYPKGFEVFQLWRYPLFYLHKGACLSLLVVTAYLLYQFVKADRRQLTLPHLFGIRSGLTLMTLALAYSILRLQVLGMHLLPYTAGFDGLPLFNWQVRDFGIRGFYLAASQAIWVMPTLGYLIGRAQDRRYDTAVAGGIAAITILLVIGLAVAGVAQHLQVRIF